MNACGSAGVITTVLDCRTSTTAFPGSVAKRRKRPSTFVR